MIGQSEGNSSEPRSELFGGVEIEKIYTRLAIDGNVRP
jgi:hypothetical protein